ncbi:type II toxin-antitoxin system VapC family toxin [Thiocapsa sp.]|uniref:type II toxin-antitoxin system VapC family toxin n=1 Tax=Thiocapsa sp. TaxID=2024551 RepID=UPI00359463A6
MIILPATCALIYDALTPERLSAAAVEALSQGESAGTLACSVISLWEIAMLITKGRLSPGTDAKTFCQLALDARGTRVLPITPAIAARSVAIDLPRADPADRLIAATTLEHNAILVTIDQKLRDSSFLATTW